MAAFFLLGWCPKRVTATNGPIDPNLKLPEFNLLSPVALFFMRRHPAMGGADSLHRET
jgi:hypothetical protein